MAIISIKAREILDSRGNPTVEVDLKTDNGIFRAAVPSGASTGEYEAVELRDGGERYKGKGTTKAVKNVKEIAEKIIDMDETEQKNIDKTMIELDGTENKGRLGANAILAVSMAVCKAGAAKKDMPLYKYIAELSGTKEMVLPVPSFNVLNGGKHAGNKLAMQEFMIMPIGAPNFKEALRYGSEVYHTLKDVIKNKYGQNATNVGDEGGFAPDINNAEEALDLITTAIKEAGYENEVKIAMDPAASEFFEDGYYNLGFKDPENNDKKTGDEMIEYYKKLTENYEIISLEDPFDQNDWDSYTKLTERIGEKIQVVGDDLLVTNPKRIEKGIEKKSCNALLLKVNQIGTVTESIEACKIAKSAGWGVMVSHRSGETVDSFIADLTVGLKTGQIKSGAPCRSERTEKYNQLMRIEEELENSSYAGRNFRTV